MRRFICLIILGLTVSGCVVDDGDVGEPTVGAVRQAEETLTRSPWQMHHGLEVTPANPLGLLPFTCAPTQHGQICEYDVATVPPADDLGWGPAPDGEIIGLYMPCGESRVCQAPVTCLRYGDFSYFQTLVSIPEDVFVTEFTIAFWGMDDGSRVSIYNSSYPDGLVIPGSYVYYGGSGTTNLAPYVLAGEVNRVVVTQVDDCCCENYLRSAQVVLNGEVIDTGCHAPADCDDGNACTVDVCNDDGTCSNPAASCDDNDVCTIDICDTSVGCTYQALSCDDGDSCTLDVCDPVAGCSSTDQCPDCGAAFPTLAEIWPVNHKLIGVGVEGVTDPQGQSSVIRIDSIAQDEPPDTLGDGTSCPDADGVGTSTALVRAERTGTKAIPGDGRVYHIAFTATDPDGHTCAGEVTSCVPHDRGTPEGCVDQGALYDSLVCE